MFYDLVHITSFRMCVKSLKLLTSGLHLFIIRIHLSTDSILVNQLIQVQYLYKKDIVRHVKHIDIIV